MEPLDFGDYPVIHAETVGDMFMIGGMLHVQLCEWKRFNGVLRLSICAEVIRPTTGATRAQLDKWFEMQIGPSVH